MRHTLYSSSEGNFMPFHEDHASIKILSPEDIHTYLDPLSDILVKSVQSGAAIRFVMPFTKMDARAYWWNEIIPAVQTGQHILFAAFENNVPVGTVQLIQEMPSNQPHRCEVSKLMVHPDHRRKGIAGELMHALETQANFTKRSLITLDTRTGDIAEGFYRSLGFTQAGVIPNFALDPDGKAFHGTTYMYKELGAHA